MTTPKPVEKPRDTYLGPLCPVCHVPIECHPIVDEKSGCFAHVPILGRIYLSRELSEARVSAVALDVAESDEGRDRYRERRAEAEEDERKKRYVVPWWKQFEAAPPAAPTTPPDDRKQLDDWRTGFPAGTEAV